MRHVTLVFYDKAPGNAAPLSRAKGRPYTLFRPAMKSGLNAQIWLLTLVLLITHAVPCLSENKSPRVVSTKYGKLRGIIRELPQKHLKSVEVFLGVRYAKPPMGSNRFSPTRTPNPWPGEKLADQYGPVCPQRHPELWDEIETRHIPRARLHHLRKLHNYFVNQAEDCLFLNLYVPGFVSDTVGHRALPVIVFVHGESFEWGGSNAYDGSVLAALGEVIVVTFNYRLGPLGFMNTNQNGKRHVMNHGLLDQIAALNWIQDNIGAFGGDPGSVTLLGHGTGAACIHFLMVSAAVVPGLFHRVILMSGSALSSWAVVGTPAFYALQFGKSLNCTDSIPEKIKYHEKEYIPSDHEFDTMITCLKNKTVEELNSVNIKSPRFLYAFGPSVDGIVVSDDYLREIDRRRPDENGKEYDMLFGVVPQDAYNDLGEKEIQEGLSTDQRDRIFRTLIRNSYDYHLNEVFISVVNEYTNWDLPSAKPTLLRDTTLEALSDARFVAPLIRTARNFRAGNKNQYFYVFNHDGSRSNTENINRIKGAIHGSELPYVFGAPLVGQLGVYSGNWSDQDQLISEVMIVYLTNFAKTGNPNLKADQELKQSQNEITKYKTITWEPYDVTYQKYIEIGLRPRIRNHYRAHQLALWTWLIPQLQNVGRTEFLTLRDPLEKLDDEDAEEKLQELSVLHHLFSTHDDPSLYWGSVRPLSHMEGHYILPPTTTTMFPPSTTPIPSIISDPSKQRPFENSNATAIANAIKPYGAVDYVAYSTALSVTIAIGVSLLILNILIFAGVYYQRDRSRMDDKYDQQSQQNSQSSCEQQMSAISGATGPLLGSTLALDVTKSPMSTTSTLQTQPHSPTSQHQAFTHISECPPAFADTPLTLSNDPQGTTQLPMIGVIPQPNGSATIVGGQCVPRAPPPPRLLSSETQPLLPINVPAPPRGKIPPYEELRV